MSDLHIHARFSGHADWSRPRRAPRRTGLKMGRVAIGPRGVSWLHIVQRGWSWGRGQRDGWVVCPSSLPSFSIVGVSQSEVRLERLFYLSERRKWHKLIRSGLFRRPRLDTGIFCTEDASSTALKDGESFKFISSRILPWLWEAPGVYQCLVGQSPETVSWLGVSDRRGREGTAARASVCISGLDIWSKAAAKEIGANQLWIYTISHTHTHSHSQSSVLLNHRPRSRGPQARNLSSVLKQSPDPPALTNDNERSLRFSSLRLLCGSLRGPKTKLLVCGSKKNCTSKPKGSRILHDKYDLIIFRLQQFCAVYLKNKPLLFFIIAVNSRSNLNWQLSTSSCYRYNEVDSYST